MTDEQTITKVRALLKGESAKQVPTVIGAPAWRVAMCIDTEVEKLFEEAGLARATGAVRVNRVMAAIAKMVQFSINEELDKVRAVL